MLEISIDARQISEPSREERRAVRYTLYKYKAYIREPYLVTVPSPSYTSVLLCISQSVSCLKTVTG